MTGRSGTTRTAVKGLGERTAVNRRCWVPACPAPALQAGAERRSAVNGLGERTAVNRRCGVYRMPSTGSSGRCGKTQRREGAGGAHRRKQAVLGVSHAQHRLFRPVRNQFKPINNDERTI